MFVLLEVTDGPDTGRKIQLRKGQKATIGRTNLADYNFQHDSAMAEQHFAIECTSDGCQLLSMPSCETKVNDEAVTEIALESGTIIRAGQTSFSVKIDGQQKVSEPDESESVEPEVPVAVVMGIPELLAHLDIEFDEPELQAKAEQQADFEALIAHLEERGEVFPALRVRAHVLEHRPAVWWATLCVREFESKSRMKQIQYAAIASAELWVKKPEEDVRRAAEEAANETGVDGPGGLIAQAAFCCGDSIGLPDYDPVVPDERLTGSLVAGALMLFGYEIAEEAEERLAAFLKLGKDVQDGTIPVPEIEEAT